jgi:hypothetical protein
MTILGKLFNKQILFGDVLTSTAVLSMVSGGVQGFRAGYINQKIEDNLYKPNHNNNNNECK